MIKYLITIEEKKKFDLENEISAHAILIDTEVETFRTTKAERQKLKEIDEFIENGNKIVNNTMEDSEKLNKQLKEFIKNL